MLPTFQSAYRPFHSTQTVAVSILNDMITAVDSGPIGALMLLDLSAAFDTVDHSVLLDVLYRRFGITGRAFGWFDAFLSDHHQTVHFGGTASDDTTLLFGVPQGSVLCPKVFSQYVEDVAEIFCRHNSNHHLFADDMQGHSSSLPKDAATVTTQLSSCAKDMTGAKPNVCSSMPVDRSVVVRYWLTAASATTAMQDYNNQQHCH